MTEELSSSTRKAFRYARLQIRGLVAEPVKTWLSLPAPKRSVDAYRQITDIPLDLAGAGFDVRLTQAKAGWVIEVRREISPTVELHLHGESTSFVNALFQIGNEAIDEIDRLERKARRQLESAHYPEDAA